MVARGQRLAGTRNAPNLRFSTSSELDRADVWMAAGSLHYVEESAATIISRMRQLPRWVLLNKVPLTDGEPFVTGKTFSAGG